MAKEEENRPGFAGTVHPRNIYKGRTLNLKALAQLNPLLETHLTLSAKGKPITNMTNQSAEFCTCLSELLLKKDFGLNIKVLKDSSDLALPLFLNHILWIEDILTGTKMDTSKKLIAVGTGSCVYSLILAKRNGWSFIVTESDETNFAVTKENINNNNLAEKIRAAKSDSLSALKLAKFGQYKFDFLIVHNFDIMTNYETFLKESISVKSHVRFFTTVVKKLKLVRLICKSLAQFGVTDVETKSFIWSGCTNFAVVWSFTEKIPKIAAIAYEGHTITGQCQFLDYSAIRKHFINKFKDLFKRMKINFQLNIINGNAIFILKSHEVLWMRPMQWEELGIQELVEYKISEKNLRDCMEEMISSGLNVNKATGEPMELEHLRAQCAKKLIKLEKQKYALSLPNCIVQDDIKLDSHLVDEWLDDHPLDQNKKYLLNCEFELVPEKYGAFKINLTNLTGGSPTALQLLHELLDEIIPKGTVITESTSANSNGVQ